MYQWKDHIIVFLCDKSDDFIIRKCIKEQPNYSINRSEIVSNDELDVNGELACNSVSEILNNSGRIIRKRLSLSGYCYSYFRYILTLSNAYRNLVFSFLSSKKTNNGLLCVRINVLEPKYHILDYKWCYMLCHLCEERRELEVTMSWLSTLGGAFSSLGDNFEYCAITAGKISAHQFALALRLGDPTTVIRCKLYLAISLIQRKKYRLASRLIRSQWAYVHSFIVIDKRLVNMCLGIWAKLKYERSLVKSRCL